MASSSSSVSTPGKKVYGEHPFEEIYENVYVNFDKPKSKVTHFDQCDCHRRGFRCMSDQCINRSSKCECSKETCPCGTECQNQKLQRHDNADVYVFDAGNAGKGLKTARDIPAGTFIMEYVGEVIDWEEYGDRDDKYKKEGLIHRYFLLLDSIPDTDEENIYIDSQKKANKTRYINHSCDPNCNMEKWDVGKEKRMAVYTNQALAKDTELTFDYKWEAMGAEPQIKCYCGSENCRGFVDYKRNKRSPQGSMSARRQREEAHQRMTEDDVELLRQQNKEEHERYRFPSQTEKEAGIELVSAKVRMYYDDQKCYFNGTIIDFKIFRSTRKMMHKIKFLFDGEETWFDLHGAEKGNWQILKGFIIQVRPTSTKSDRDADMIVRGITLRNFPSCKVKDLQEILEEGIRPFFERKLLNPRHVNIDYYGNGLNGNSNENMEVEPMCLVTMREEAGTQREFEWNHDIRVKFRNKKVMGRELKAIPEEQPGVDGIRRNRDLLPYWPPPTKKASSDAMDVDDDDVIDETKRQLHFPFRINWRSKKAIKLRESRRDRILMTIKDYLKILQNEQDVLGITGWGNVYPTSVLTCLRYLTALEIENKAADTTQLAIASLIATLKYLGLFEPISMWDLIFQKFLELGNEVTTKSDGDDDNDKNNRANDERESKKKELIDLEKHLAQVIWFDITDPYTLLNAMVKEALSPDISTGDSKLLSNVSKEIIRHTIMETIWVQNTTNLIVACVIVIASEVVTKVYTDNALPLDNTKFTNAFLNAMKNNMKVAAKEISLLCNSPGILKSLEKFSKKNKDADLSIDSFKQNVKESIQQLTNQYTSSDDQVPNSSSLVLVPDVALPRPNKVTVIQKSMGSEQRGHNGLWADFTGTDASALHELYTLRRLHHPIRHNNIWIPSKVAKRDLSRASTSKNGNSESIANDDVNMPVDKTDAVGGASSSSLVKKNKNTFQYCMYTDKLGENLAVFLKKNKNLSLKDLMNIAKQIVAAVRHCCMKKSVLHGQLSPANVYVANLDGYYNVTLKGFGGSSFYTKQGHITALENQWNKYDGWRRDRKKLESKRSETDKNDKKKQKMLKKEIIEIYTKSKQALADILKKFELLPSHVLPHMAPELLMGSVVYNEPCEAWSLGSLLFFLFSRGKLFAGVSKEKKDSSSSSSANKSNNDNHDAIDKTRRDILNTIFGRCSRAKMPKEMRSYPGRMNVSEKPDDGKKHLERVISWLSKNALKEDDTKIISQLGETIYGLLKIAPRERTKLKKVVKHELFYSEKDDEYGISRPPAAKRWVSSNQPPPPNPPPNAPAKRWVSDPVEAITTTTTMNNQSNNDDNNGGYALESTNTNDNSHGYDNADTHNSTRYDNDNYNRGFDGNNNDDRSSRKRRFNDNDNNNSNRRFNDNDNNNNNNRRWSDDNNRRDDRDNSNNYDNNNNNSNHKRPRWQEHDGQQDRRW